MTVLDNQKVRRRRRFLTPLGEDVALCVLVFAVGLATFVICSL